MGSDEDDDDEDDDDEDDDEDEEEDNDHKVDKKPERRFGEPKPVWKTGHDVSENKTVFVRNLNFESDQVSML